MTMLNQEKKPKPPKIKIDSIPVELKSINQWCCWFYKWNGKKWSKPPCNIEGNTTDHHQMNYTFDEVYKAYNNNKDIAGIGISIRDSDKMCGIDIDHVVKKGKIKNKAKAAIKSINTYWEISPSGEGLRAFGFGNIPTHGSRKGIPIETYKEGRYLTVTGNTIGGSELKRITKKQTKKVINTFYKDGDYQNKNKRNGTKLDNGGLSSEEFIEDKTFITTVFACKPDSYQTWLEVGFAIHHKYRGHESGLSLWEQWSKGCSDKFEIGVCHKKWKGFKIDKKNPLTIATVIKRQNESGLYNDGDPLSSEGALIAVTPTKATKLLKEKHKAISYYLGDTFPNKSVCMVHATRGVGKSFFCMSIALAVSNATSFLRWAADKKKKTLYIEGELPRVKVQEMIKTCSKALGLNSPGDNLSFLTVDDFPNSIFPSLSSEQGRSVINQVIQSEKPELIIIDSLATCFKFREEKQNEWLEIQDWLLALRASGISVVLVHHDNKAGTGQRGFSNKEDVMDTVLHLKQSKAYDPSHGACFNVNYSKHRYTYGKGAGSFQARLVNKKNDSHWVVEAANNNNYDAACVLVREGFAVREVADKLGISYQGAKKHIERAVKEGGLKQSEVDAIMKRRSVKK